MINLINFKTNLTEKDRILFNKKIVIFPNQQTEITHVLILKMKVGGLNTGIIVLLVLQKNM